MKVFRPSVTLTQPIQVNRVRIPAGSVVAWSDQRNQLYFDNYPRTGYVSANGFFKAVRSAAAQLKSAAATLEGRDGRVSEVTLTQPIAVNRVRIPAGSVVARSDQRGQLYFDSYPTTGYVGAKEFLEAVRSAAAKLNSAAATLHGRTRP